MFDLTSFKKKSKKLDIAMSNFKSLKNKVKNYTLPCQILNH